VRKVKKHEEHVVCVGKEKKKNIFVEAVKFGAGFYVGFNMARVIKRLFIITNISK
jgi:hypothetical protein